MEQLKSKEGPDWKLWEQPASYPSEGLLALRAGEAARKQGEEAFQRFHLALLNAHHLERKSLDQIEVMLDVANRTGLELPKFREDLEDSSHLKKIGADYTEGREKYGVFGTPTIISLNGNAGYLKMMPPPAPEDAVGVFHNLFSIISGMPHVGEIKRPEPSFEDSVYEFLVIHRYRVDKGVAHAGRHVDLAVEDLDSLGTYILGILCISSQSSASLALQEQEQVQQAGPQTQGMRIYQISSADWERERGPTEDKLLDALRSKV